MGKAKPYCTKASPVPNNTLLSQMSCCTNWGKGQEIPKVSWVLNQPEFRGCYQKSCDTLIK